MPKPSALMVLDVQNGLFQGERPTHEGDLISRINGLVSRAREASIPILYIQDSDVGEVGGSEWDLHAGLDARPEDARIQKSFSDAFYQTDLKQQLDSMGVERLIVTGCTTDSCVDMTCRRAVALGYDVVLAADGHSTRDNSFMTAQQSIAYYNRILDGFGSEDGFGEGKREILVQPSDEIEF